MKTFNLKAYGVSEMSALEASVANGGGPGGPPIASYLTDAQIAAGSEIVGNIYGLVCGIILGALGIAK